MLPGRLPQVSMARFSSSVKTGAAIGQLAAQPQRLLAILEGPLALLRQPKPAAAANPQKEITFIYFYI